MRALHLIFPQQKEMVRMIRRQNVLVNNIINCFIIIISIGQTLEGVSLELMLLDWDRVTKNEVIGRLELGGPRSTGSALNHWKEVCNSPRRQIADWHKLRE